METAREVLEHFGKASEFLDKVVTKWQLPLACEVAKETLRRSAAELVREAAGLPMVTTKSCDGTPITVAHRSQVRQPGGKRARVTGRECQ